MLVWSLPNVKWMEYIGKVKDIFTETQNWQYCDQMISTEPSCYLFLHNVDKNVSN